MVAEESSRPGPSQSLAPEAFAPSDACTSPGATASASFRQFRRSCSSLTSAWESRSPHRRFVEFSFMAGKSAAVRDRRNSIGKEGPRCQQGLPWILLYTVPIYTSRARQHLSLFRRPLLAITGPASGRSHRGALSPGSRNNGWPAKSTRLFGLIRVYLGSIRTPLGPSWVEFARNSTLAPGFQDGVPQRSPEHRPPSSLLTRDFLSDRLPARAVRR
jgi:hypothetical protein